MHKLSSYEIKRYSTKSWRQKGVISVSYSILISIHNVLITKCFSKALFIKSDAKVYLHEFDMALWICFRHSFAWIP